MTQNKHTYISLAIFFILLMLFPLLQLDFYNEMVSRIVILALFALSLDLLVGFTGLVSFGHAAWFGVGAYGFALLSTQYRVADSLWVTLPLSLLAAAVLSFIVGLFVLRTKGIYFIMVTLAFAQVFYFLVHDVPAIGGSTDGINLYARPSMNIGGWEVVNLEDPLGMYYFIVASLLASLVFLWAFLRSPLGRAIQGIKVNEHRMSSIGFPVFKYKLISFVVSGMLAAFAGYLFAVQSYGVNPELLSWHKSADALLMLIFGGMGYLYGGILGAFAFVLLKEFFMVYTVWWQLWLGTAIVLLVLFLPGGLASLPNRLRVVMGRLA